VPRLPTTSKTPGSFSERIVNRSVPPRAETGTVQPRGCTERTFTGSSFNALPIVAQAVRAITETLLHGRSDADASRDVFICSQPREPEGLITAPSWKAFPLSIHPNCEWCAAPA
jgi:hypothetical protein